MIALCKLQEKLKILIKYIKERKILALVYEIYYANYAILFKHLIKKTFKLFLGVTAFLLFRFLLYEVSLVYEQ